MPTKLFVGNLPKDCSKDTIRDVFSSYGTIHDITVTKKFAFVYFVNEEDASSAVRNLYGSKIADNTITVEISKKQDDNANKGKRDNGDSVDRGRDRGDRGRSIGGRARGGLNHGRSGGTLIAGNALGMGPALAGRGGPLIRSLGRPSLGVLGGPPSIRIGMPPLGGFVVPALCGQRGPPLATILGGLAPLGGHQILSAINLLAEVAQKQQSLSLTQQQSSQPSFHESEVEREEEEEEEQDRKKPDPNIRVRRKVVNTHDIPNVSSTAGLTNGYVIYERYYVDPGHPLLKGLPLPEVPRMSNRREGRDKSRNDIRKEDDDVYRDVYRDRSPVLNNGTRSDFHRDYRNDHRR